MLITVMNVSLIFLLLFSDDLMFAKIKIFLSFFQVKFGQKKYLKKIVGKINFAMHIAPLTVGIKEMQRQRNGVVILLICGRFPTEVTQGLVDNSCCVMIYLYILLPRFDN